MKKIVRFIAILVVMTGALIGELLLGTVGKINRESILDDKTCTGGAEWVT